MTAAKRRGRVGVKGSEFMADDLQRKFVAGWALTCHKGQPGRASPAIRCFECNRTEIDHRRGWEEDQSTPSKGHDERSIGRIIIVSSAVITITWYIFHGRPSRP